jgi:hypothetical protein
VIEKIREIKRGIRESRGLFGLTRKKVVDEKFVLIFYWVVR